MYIVQWSDEAIKDLIVILEFLSRKSPKAAKKQIDAIFSREGQLKKYPFSGSIQTLKTLEKEYRYLVEGNYKIIYHVDEDKVRINAVFDTRQDPEKMFLK